MAYSKQTWDTNSYVNPTRMNHIEEGIYDASKGFDLKEITGYTVHANVNSQNVKVYEYLGFIIVTFLNAEVTGGVGAFQELVKSLPISKVWSSGNIYAYSGNTATPILIYIGNEGNTNQRIIRNATAISSTAGTVIAGHIMYLKA